MKRLQGVPASDGLAIGPIFIVRRQVLEVASRSIDDPEAELLRLEEAVQTARRELEKIHRKAAAEAGEKEAAIFEAHALFLEDPALLGSVREAISTEQINVESAWKKATEDFAQQMDSMEDEYFRARAADIRDVGARVLRHLLDVEEPTGSGLEHPAIIVARDLTPSQTVRLNKALVLGFCTAEGGPTSHTTILAKALGLPAVVGVGEEILQLVGGETCLLNGNNGEVLIDPGQAILEEFLARKARQAARSETHLAVAREPARTLDGRSLEVVANVGSIDEAKACLVMGAEGIGLLRTEFLYLGRATAPDEEEQLAAYLEILRVMEGRPVVVRTLDVGGDKPLPYVDLGSEENSFLGWRAIRMCLDEPGLFQVQLRALLRASPGHDLRIMFPMIATIEEIREARAILEQVQQELIAEGHAVAEKFQVGMMVEVPSVAVLADQFAAEVDFFSIGTNDLTQYTLAADRTNPKVAHLGDACHPAVLRLIQGVIRAGHGAGLWVGLCGELAGDPDAVPILLGLGLDEFSMAPSSIPSTKALLRRLNAEEASRLAQEVLSLQTAADVRRRSRELIHKTS